MDSQLKNVLKTFKLNEDTISTVLGGIVIVIIGLLVFNYFKSVNPSGSITPVAQETVVTPEPGKVELIEENGKMIPKGLPTTYKVQKGDHLWSIAENFYNSGYNWSDIAIVNNLTDANEIDEGQELTIPKVEVKQPTVALKGESDTIDDNKYTVQKGDHLWEISVRAYGDGFQWTKIYEANKDLIGSNPSAIEINQELTIPRK